MSTALGFSPWCKNRGSFGLYESCGGDEVSKEVFAAAATIEELKEALQRSTMASKERKLKKKKRKSVENYQIERTSFHKFLEDCSDTMWEISNLVKLISWFALIEFKALYTNRDTHFVTNLTNS